VSDNCQALVEDGDGWQRVCRQPRVASVEVSVGDVQAFIDLCAAHDELARLTECEAA
jgi:hypothetical protein